MKRVLPAAVSMLCLLGWFTNVNRAMSAENKEVKVGTRAPDFELAASDGQTVSLAQFRGQKNVVLFFYPKDFTPGCTAEVCQFRDDFEKFKDAGAEVIGVSGDSIESHRKFAGEHQLPFLLLSDADGKLRELYRVPASFGLLPGRVTYVIDRQGVIRHIFNSQMNATRHVAEALQILEKLGK